MSITLPLESEIIMHKDGTSTVTHKKMVTGEMGQPLAEVFLELMGGSVEDLEKLFENEGKAAG